MLDAAVIVVNYRTAELTLKLLQQMLEARDERPKELIVVDNSPEEGLQRQITGIGKRIDYYPSLENIGFAAAVNLGLDRCNEEKVILLNPDCKPKPGCLSELVSVLNKEPRAAVVGPRLIPTAPGSKESPSATLSEPRIFTMLLEHTALHRIVPGGRSRLYGEYFPAIEPGESPIECAMVQGACFALRKDVADEVGGFDAERFFLYWEETDFCHQVRAKGHKVLYCPWLICRHAGQKSVEDMETFSFHYWNGAYRFFRKHRGKLYTSLLCAMLCAGMAIELMALSSIRFVRGGKNPALTRDLRLLRCHLKQQFNLLSRKR